MRVSELRATQSHISASLGIKNTAPTAVCIVQSMFHRLESSDIDVIEQCIYCMQFVIIIFLNMVAKLRT